MDYATASEMDLRYDGAIGDVEIRGSGSTLRMVALPLLDFFACLRSVVRSLEVGAAREQIESTESDHLLVFEQTGGVVRVCEADGPFACQCSLAELKLEVEQAARACLSAVMVRRPDLIRNQEFFEWFGSSTTS